MVSLIPMDLTLSQAPEARLRPRRWQYEKRCGGLCLADPFQLNGNYTNDDWAVTNPRNVRCFGFEPVQIRISASNPGLLTTQPIQAPVKVRNPASLALLSVHGSHDGRLAFGDGILDPERDLRPLDTATLETLLLLSCNVLDLHEYNNNLANEPPRSGASDPVAMRPAPGKVWRKATSSGRTVLLGYNSPVRANEGGQARTNYFQTALPDLETRGVTTEERQPLAWLKANYETAQADGTGSTLNACAWDQNYYYFISFSPPFKVEKINERRKIFGFHKVPLDGQGDNTSVDRWEASTRETL